MNEGQKKAVPKRGDIFLIGGCLLAALVCCGLWLGFRKDGGAVVVEQDGRETARYALSEDRTVRIEGEGGYNLLVIRGGECGPKHRVPAPQAGGTDPGRGVRPGRCDGGIGP